MQNSDTFHVVYAPEAVGYPIASQVQLVGRTQSGGLTSASMSAGISGALLVDAGVTLSVGSVSESAASTDTSTSGINGLLKRLLQRITTLIYPPFASGSFTNSGGASTGIDCGGYDYLVQHVSGGGGGYNRPIQWSYDNVNWTQGGVVFRHISNAGSSSTGNEAHWMVLGDILGTSSGIFVIPVVGRYFRLGASGTGGGGLWTHNWYLHKGPFPGIVEEGIGARNSSPASTDTSDVGLNGLFKRLLQRLTTLLPANLTVSSTRLLVDGSGVTQPVSLASVPSHPVTGTFWQATQPVSIASAPVTPVTDNGGSLTVDGSITATQATAASLKAQAQLLNAAGSVVDYAMTGAAGTPATDVVTVQGISGGTVIPVSLASVPSHAVTGSGSFTAAQATASSLKAQAQILDPSGSLLTYAATGTAGTPAVDVVSVQGVSSGVAIATQIRNNAGSLVTYAESGIYGNPSVDVISVQNPQGTSAAIATFTSTTASSSLVSASTTRKTLTVYNSGPGDLNISPTALCTTTNFQIRLGSNDYWECPAQQVTLAHTAVYSTSGTAYVTTVT
jgi:hypothetical protein